jgi:hypothetical protein
VTDTAETETAQTPEQLLTDLGELHTRTCVSPLPKHPAAMGWQATTGSMAAGFARALHALNEIAPDRAQEITTWFQGPFEEGPDPEEHTDWLEQNVAGSPEVLQQWVDDGRQMAVEAKENTQAWEQRNPTQVRRVLTLGEYDAAWHAVEGSAGEEGADPGTVLHAVLDRLGIDVPGPVVAYRNPDRPSVLLCRGHGRGWGLTPLTSDDLPDGGTCTYGDPADPSDVCGRDVLIEDPKAGSEGSDS